MRDFGVSKKLFFVFAVMVTLSVVAGFVTHVFLNRVGENGIRVGEKLAPLGDAAMEVKLTATRAHLLFEEIMAGDDGESIEEVWQLLEETRFYANAILNGGSNDEGTFVATESAQVRDTMLEVQQSIENFIGAAKTRYQLRAGDQGVGSGADQEFDALYDDLTARIAALAEPAADAADVQRAAGEARYRLAHGHLLVAEILGGDEGEDFNEATGSFAESKKALESIPADAVDGAKRDGIAKDIDRLVSLANARHEKSKSSAGAGSGADEAFDASFEAFIALADEAEEVIHDDMDISMAALHAERAKASLVQVGGTLLILLVAVGAGIYFSRSLAGRAVQLARTANELAAGNIDTRLPDWQSKDELGQLKVALVGFRASLVEQHALSGQVEAQQQRQEEERRRLLRQLADEFRNRTEACFSSLEEASGGLQAAVGVMADAAENSSSMVGATTEAADSASTNVETVAAAAEELSASIAEISRQVTTTASVVGSASSQAQTTSDKISGLAEAVEKIGQVVTLIQEIAEQTNLLALNATIEAARAGEMGKGFAVVAAEVKELATQTAKATDEIGEHIAAIQSSTNEAVEAITAIAGTMREIDSNTTTISAAVEEQGSATGEIASNAQMTASQTTQVSHNMESMSSAVQTVSQTSDQVRQSSASIADSTSNMRKAMAEFLARLEAA